MWIGVISIFPDMFSAITEFGITRKAFENNLLELHTWNPRDFTRDRHRTVDDRPYGGGPGMLMMVEPLRLAIQAAKKAAGDETRVIYMSPQGKKLDQASVRNLATTSKLIIVSGRYEGIDERLIQSEVDEEWSIGDYVLSGGELPSMVLIDAVARLIPGVLGHSESAVQDSYTDDLLDSPHYTRPEEIDGMCVPEVLLSGNHEQIRRWRLKQSLMRTWSRRPDLLENRELTVEERTLLNEILDEIN